jgi:hypothetical protein
LAISEPTITRKLRRELSEDTTAEMMSNIDAIAAEKAKE